MLRDLRRHFPHQAEQLEGIARGAGLPVDAIWRAMRTALADAAPGPTLGLARAGAPLLARPLPAGALLRRTRPEGRFSTLELALAPLTTPLLGVNEAGLAVTCDPGPAEPGSCAAPGALLARDCLERFADAETALAWCLARPAAGRVALLLADARGAVVGVAIARGGRRVLRQRGGLLLGGESQRAAAELAKRFDDVSFEPDAASQQLAAAFAPEARAFAWADPIGRRLLRPPSQTGRRLLRPPSQTGRRLLRPPSQTGRRLLRPPSQTGRRPLCPPDQTGRRPLCPPDPSADWIDL
jgi:hypothetical protein